MKKREASSRVLSMVRVDEKTVLIGGIGELNLFRVDTGETIQEIYIQLGLVYALIKTGREMEFAAAGGGGIIFVKMEKDLLTIKGEEYLYEEKDIVELCAPNKDTLITCRSYDGYIIVIDRKEQRELLQIHINNSPG